MKVDAVDGPVAIGEQPQPALGTQLRIEQLERPGREVARVGVRFMPGLLALLVDADQVFAGHVDFAAGLEQGGRLVCVQPQRQIADGAQVVRDVIALLAVAARGSEGEDAVLIGQGNGQAVDLEFDDVPDRLAVQQLADAFVELAQLGGTVGVVDRQHRHAMADADEPLDRLAADALGGAVGRDQFGMLGLELLQFVEEPIELAVGDLGLAST